MAERDSFLASIAISLDESPGVNITSFLCRFRGDLNDYEFRAYSVSELANFFRQFW
jgi:hypothetical protein